MNKLLTLLIAIMFLFPLQSIANNRTELEQTYIQTLQKTISLLIQQVELLTEKLNVLLAIAEVDVVTTNKIELETAPVVLSTTKMKLEKRQQFTDTYQKKQHIDTFGFRVYSYGDLPLKITKFVVSVTDFPELESVSILAGNDRPLGTAELINGQAEISINLPEYDSHYHIVPTSSRDYIIRLNLLKETGLEEDVSINASLLSIITDSTVEIDGVLPIVSDTLNFVLPEEEEDEEEVIN